MKTISRFLVIALASMSIVTLRADDLSEAMAGCSAYRDALLKKDADAAWALVDSKTQEYYASIAKMAIGASRQELQKLDIIAKLTVLRCRVEFKKEVIAKMTAQVLFSEGVRRGWISRSSAESLQGLVAISSDASSATLALPSQPKTPVIYMIKQTGRWKVELWRAFGPGNQLLRNAAQENGLSEDKFVEQMLDSVSVSGFDEALWEAPAK